jgi:AbrB family looped-hinge helix DNA binding protein
MALAYSKLTAQGHISIPTAIRRKLGLRPGSVREWDDRGKEIVVRRASRYTSEDVHRTMFPKPPKPKTLAEIKAGLRQHMKQRHARD